MRLLIFLKKYAHIISLLLISPAIGEILTGSTPITQFFLPWVLPFQLALYGGGALLIRELRVRWNAGPLAILFLGVAYGIFEEGLVCASFFDPHWHDLGPLENFARVFGVNWGWTFHLAIFHAFESIFFALMLVDLIFPQKKNTLWLSRKGVIACLLGLGTVLILSLLVLPYKLAGGEVVGCLIAMAVFSGLAWRYREFRPEALRPKWGWVGVASAAMVLFYFLFAWRAFKPLPITYLLGITLIGAGIFYFVSRVSMSSWRIRIAYVLGNMAPYILVNLVAHPKPGMIVVGILSIVALILLLKTRPVPNLLPPPMSPASGY